MSAQSWDGLDPKTEEYNILMESDLESFGFSKHLMLGTGYLTISSMQPAQYYYKKGNITINCTHHWTWFLNGQQDNSIAVGTKTGMRELLGI